jgi:hypothetical protein|tara:strand:- start:325 stop:651 length:327 start_codon:yes stop_codon:yes gene_type:complete
MTVQEFVDQGGRIFHRREGNGRVITVAYTTSDDVISYGATIFRPSQGDSSFKRKLHNTMAVARCSSAPVNIADGDLSNRDRHELIRSAMFTFGVSACSPAYIRNSEAA